MAVRCFPRRPYLTNAACSVMRGEIRDDPKAADEGSGSRLNYQKRKPAVPIGAAGFRLNGVLVRGKETTDQRRRRGTASIKLFPDETGPVDLAWSPLLLRVVNQQSTNTCLANQRTSDQEFFLKFLRAIGDFEVIKFGLQRMRRM